jgi:nitrogen fixation protein FixH
VDNLVLTLGGGVVLSFLAFALIYRLTRLRGYQVALVVIVGMLCVFLPLQIVFWQGVDVFAIHLALFVITPYGMAIVTAQWEASRGAERRGGGWIHWAPATIVAFFLVIATVDATIISLANHGMPSGLVGRILPEPRSGAEHVTSHFPGTVANDYFKKEPLFNEHLARLAEQEERGWEVRQGWIGTPRLGSETVFQVKVLDGQGKPLSGARVEGWFARPSDERQDRMVRFEAVGPGIYQAPVALAMPGAWEVRLRVEREGDVHEQRGVTSVREG